MTMGSTTVTMMNERETVLTWEIRDLDKCLRLDPESNPGEEYIDQILSSPMEVAQGTSLHSKWKFKLTSQKDTAGVGHLALGVHLQDLIPDKPFVYDSDIDFTVILCAYDIGLSSGTGQNLFAAVKRCRYYHRFSLGFDPNFELEEDKVDYYVYTNIMPVRDFVTEVRNHCPDNKLVVHITFTVIFDAKHLDLPSLRVEDIAKKVSGAALTQSYTRLWTDESFAKFSDFKILCGDPSQTFNVNKAILAARSPYFETYFADRWNNSSTSRDEYKDAECTPETFKSLLKFIYAGELDIPQAPEKAALVRLIHAAEKYQLTDLKAACFYRMFTNITDENAGEFAVAAHTYNADEDCAKLIRNYCVRRHEHLMQDTKYKELFKSKQDAFL